MPFVNVQPSDAPPTVLHYTGADDDRGGIVSAILAMQSAGRFAGVLGVNRGFRAGRSSGFPRLEFLPLAGERLGVATFWRARSVAREVQHWIQAEPNRVYHGHSRAGLAVALWLARRGERRAVVTVHCYGRQRWFYRWAARQLGSRLFWLTPAMKRHYGVEAPATWAHCLPGCLPDEQIDAGYPPRDYTRRPLRLAGIGALVEWKQWHAVLEALAVLPPSSRDQFRFEHIGAGEDSGGSRRYAGELRAQTVRLKLEQHVTWRGAEPSSRRLLAEANCLLVPSRGEPFSMAMLESLAAGVPVLAAAGGGPGDVLTPGLNGWLFDPARPGALAARIQELLHPDALAGIRIEAEQLRAYRASTVAEAWRKVYRDCLA